MHMVVQVTVVCNSIAFQTRKWLHYVPTKNTVSHKKFEINPKGFLS
jgi:hypothetical protein